jgi:presenilin-like A22 family membrane protease
VVVNPETGEEEIVEVYPEENKLPFGMQPPKGVGEEVSLISIIISFIIAVVLILILSKYKWKFLIKAWFFVVVSLALGIALNAVLKNFSAQAYLVSLVIAVPIAYFKIYKTNFIIHNLTELFIYPGIAAVFVPILGVWTIVLLLILISLYDMWAVWHTGIMQKMAKFHIKELKIFTGFLIPHISKKLKEKLRKSKKKKKKIRISLGALGGGDIVFPMITAGVFLRSFGLVSALFIIFGAFIGLSSLLLKTEKGKAYPAMPFITAGIFLGMILWRVLVF